MLGYLLSLYALAALVALVAALVLADLAGRVRDPERRRRRRLGLSAQRVAKRDRAAWDRTRKGVS